MGRPLAGHLLSAGHALAVWSRRPESSAPLQAAGARVCISPADVARHARIVFTMVTGSEDVAAVTLGADGLMQGWASGPAQGPTLVDLSTIAPSVARSIAGRLAERGIAMLDAPVSGGVTAALSASLAIMVGGPAETLAQVRPLFDLLGKTIVHVGENGAGQVAKACNQMVMVAAIQACAEAMRLASAGAVDPSKVRLALLGGAAGSKVLEVFGERMVDRNFLAGVQARLHHKDFGILLEEAQRLGCPLPIAARVGQQLNALMGHGWGRDDSASLLRVLEQASSRP
jgi:2-hydroxy-3-oxopropionate reductase